MPDQGVQIHPLRPLAKALVLSVMVGACAPAVPLMDPTLDKLPARAEVDGVPLILQRDHYCGPAALAMVLTWAGLPAAQEDIARLSFSPGARGTYRSDLVGAARRLGYLAVPLTDSGRLLDEVAAGHPVIVFQNLSLGIAPRWHYAVVVGYDTTRKEIILHSGELERTRMDFAVFQRTWARGEYWAIVVLPPGELPAVKDEETTLRAVVGLESAGKPAAAKRAYAAGSAHWPENWLWQFGRGNAAYAQGDLRAAEDAFLAAQRLAPSVPEIQNNLTQVRRELRSD